MLAIILTLLVVYHTTIGMLPPVVGNYTYFNTTMIENQEKERTVNPVCFAFLTFNFEMKIARNIPLIQEVRDYPTGYA